MNYNLQRWLEHAEEAKSLRDRLIACGCRDTIVLAKLDEHVRMYADRVASHITVHTDRIDFEDPVP